MQSKKTRPPAGPEGTSDMYDELAPTSQYLRLPLLYLFLNLYNRSIYDGEGCQKSDDQGTYFVNVRAPLSLGIPVLAQQVHIQSNHGSMEGSVS